MAAGRQRMGLHRSARMLVIFFAALFQASLGVWGDENVTLGSITIYKTHEWFRKNPNLYFQCKGEPKVHLPDVTETYQLYTFIGEESWQPVTTLEREKCKRCGIYGESILRDDTYDEWELCPSGFSVAPEGHYVHFKEGEFNATFICPQCHLNDGTNASEGKKVNDEGKKAAGVSVLVIIFVFLVVTGLGVVAYMRWQKKRREEQQARFIRLFEDDEDFEAELGL